LKIKNRNTSSNQLASNVLQNKSFVVEDKPVEKENTNTSQKIEFIITEPETSTSVEIEPKFKSTSNLLMKMSPSFDENYLFNDTLSEKNITTDLSSAHLSKTTDEEHSKDINEAFTNYTNSCKSESKIDALASQVSAGTTATSNVENKKENKNSKWKNVFNRVDSMKTAKQRAKSETEKYVQMDVSNLTRRLQFISTTRVFIFFICMKRISIWTTIYRNRSQKAIKIAFQSWHIQHRLLYKKKA
jgi:hypothetical protein